MDFIVTAGAEDYEEIRTIECLECGHVSVRDPEQMTSSDWIHTCPGCGASSKIEPWEGHEG